MSIDSHLNSLVRGLALCSSTFENYIVMGNFIIEVDDIAMSDFCNTFYLEETCIVNGGKTTKCFKLERGARQRYSVPAYLFITVLEIFFYICEKF